MEIQLQIKMNKELFLRNPEQSKLGKKIIMRQAKTSLSALTLKRHWGISYPCLNGKA